MKKTILVLATLLVLSLVSVYFFIPAKININKSISVKANTDAVFRYLRSDSAWINWQPGESATMYKKPLFFDENSSFFVTKTLLNGFVITSVSGTDTLETVLNLIPNRSDSMILNWSTNLNTGLNPVTKIRQFIRIRNFKNSLDPVLAKMAAYFSDTKNVYGFDIKEEKVQYEFVTSTKYVFDHYPSTEDVYTMIDKVRNYIASSGGKEFSYPMLNVHEIDNAHFETKVAIPTDIELSSTNQFFSKWMLKGGSILVTEVKGGHEIINEAMRQVDLYITDHLRNRIAIPFQSLITDRHAEPDSSKWITKVYFPVI